MGPVHRQCGLSYPRRPADRRDDDHPRGLLGRTAKQLGQRGQLVGAGGEMPDGSGQFPWRGRRRPARHRRRGLGFGQRGVLGEDPLVQLAEFGAGLGAKLLDQGAADMPVVLKRLGRPAAPE
jgi:hypothetical protein